VKILFCTSDKIGARIIRGVTWSDFSHVAIIDGDEVIEAVWPRVRVTPLADVLAGHTRCVIVEIPCDEKAAILAARSQIGKPYDLKGMIGLGFNRDWQDDASWWCSELTAWAIASGGNKLYRDQFMHRVTPQDMWLPNFPMTVVKE
jgi:uncharacterized protein YycO